MRHLLKIVFASLIFLSCLLPATLSADTTTPIVVKLTIHDTIQPITADYLQRGLEEAARQQAQLVIVSLGTPGGLLESTRVMVQAIENSPVPVVIFISPTGSRAGSAGFFLLEAADIAAMAPGTNAGAAHPIVEGGQMDPVLKQKIENDAAAFLRSYTGRRGRNVQAAEDAIRNSKSYSDDEARNLKLIDLVTLDDASLLHLRLTAARSTASMALPRPSICRERTNRHHRTLPCASACSANSPTPTSRFCCLSSVAFSSISSSTYPAPWFPAPSAPSSFSSASSASTCSHPSARP